MSRPAQPLVCSPNQRVEGSELLIRRSMERVRSVCRNPYPQVSVLPDVRHERRGPAPSDTVREKAVRDSGHLVALVLVTVASSSPVRQWFSRACAVRCLSWLLPRYSASRPPAPPKIIPRISRAPVADWSRSCPVTIRRNRHIVQDRPLQSVRWTDIPQLSARDAPCLAAWLQC